MKSISQNLLLIVTGTILSIAASAQTVPGNKDSVAFAISLSEMNMLSFFDGVPREIIMEHNGAERVDFKTNPILRDFGAGALSLITGVGFTSSEEVNWKVDGVVACNDGLPNWNISLFCEGSWEKDRTRVRNDDGSVSLETQEYAAYYWDKDASGILIEGNDTIGFFMIITNPREDSIMKPMAEFFFPPKEIQAAAKPSTLRQKLLAIPPGKDYGIRGIMRGKPFSILSEGTQYKAWFFIDNKYVCMFQSDNGFPFIRKKDMVVPYILINDNDSEIATRKDFFRMCMLTRYLNFTIGRETPELPFL